MIKTADGRVCEDPYIILEEERFMRTGKKILSVLLALCLALALLPAMTARAQAEEADTLVVGYSPFSGKFSPFFAETAADQDAVAMTQLPLLTNDRTGAVITRGIEGETVRFNGTDYTYYGPADLTITENSDGTAYYDFKLREDLKFSDGEPLTVDDVIFSLYVLCDPTYDGSSSLFAQPILGLEEYRAGMTSLGNLINVDGPDGYRANDLYTEEQYNRYWNYYNHQAGIDLAQEIVDYCIANYAAYGAVDVTTAASLWGYELPEGATAEDFWNAIVAAYGGDIERASSAESAGSTLHSLTIAGLGTEYQTGVRTGESASGIAGIQRVDDYRLRIVATKIDPTMIYQLAISIAPLHYYGEKDKYDYAGDRFGFDKGDLSHVRSVTAQPLGAGPYRFVSYGGGTVTYKANSGYFKGEPKTPNVRFVEASGDDGKLNGIVSGAFHITDPTFSVTADNIIRDANGNGSLTGAKITTVTVNNLGYGYIGQNAVNVNVGGEPGSEASRNLRKAFATVFAVYREEAIRAYYGERAGVINYPISDSSWAAPHPNDPGYQEAFSTDVNGQPIYTSGMNAEEKYAAALQAALGYFEAAGYTVEGGRLTAAPEGAKLEYTFLIPGDGHGDHPAFQIVTEASKALKTIGMTLNINDLTNSTVLWDSLDTIRAEMWAAAWGSVVDPDMYQIYYSDVANGPSTEQGRNPRGGPAQGGSNYEYCIADPELDRIILAARSTTDQAARKELYRQGLDIIMDWAVETPTYQRRNAVLFSTELVDLNTVTPDITTFYGWMAEIEDLVLRGEAETPEPPERMSGHSRTETATAISQASFPNGSRNVILASGDNYPDALAGGPLAYALDAPILLVCRSRPDQATLDEIDRLGAKNVYILGGEGVISKAVEDTMKAKGLTVKRLAGAGRFETAVKIAEELEKIRGTKPSEAFIVFYNNYPDALAVSNVAALKGAPILYIQGSGVPEKATAGYLDKVGSFSRIWILAGPAIINSNAETNLKKYGGVTRIYGSDRYATCIKVNETFADVLSGDSLCLACGTNYPDALSGSVFAAKERAPMLLVGSSLTADQAAFVKARHPAEVYAFGGPGALSDAVLEAVKEAAR